MNAEEETEEEAKDQVKDDSTTKGESGQSRKDVTLHSAMDSWWFTY